KLPSIGWPSTICATFPGYRSKKLQEYRSRLTSPLGAPPKGEDQTVNSSQSPVESNINDKITDLVLEYALHPPAERPLKPELSLRDEIGLDSFALVSLMLRIGEEFSVDLAEE